MLTSSASAAANLQRTPLGFISDVFGTGKAASFLTLNTFVVPTGVTRIRVSVYGAGGAGASRTSHFRSSGAGGGGFARKTISVEAGEEYTITIGAAGLPVSQGNGGAGGSSSFGTILSATGGGGGRTLNTNAIVAGGSGGSGVGGDINFDGGRGGDIAAYSSGYLSTGGGGAGTIMGKGGNGGDIYGGTSLGIYQATGGGSTGGNGGDLDRDVFQSNAGTGGAGSISQAIGGNSQTSGQGHLGTTSSIRLTDTATGEELDNIEYPTLDYATRFIGESVYSNGQAGTYGNTGTTINNPKIGGASGGTGNPSGLSRGADAGEFAGSGGTAGPSNCFVGVGGLCAGSGGNVGGAFGASGGRGLVTIEW
jgi:hypothetical protein